MDWNNPATPSRRIADRTVLGAVAQTDLGPFSVGDITSVGFLLMMGGNGRARVVFDWYADQTQQVFLTSDRIDFNASALGEAGGWILPVHGAYLVVRVIPVGGAVTFTLRIWSDNVPSFVQNTNAAAGPQVTIFSQDSVVLPIGVTNFDALTLLPGEGVFLAETPAANTFISLYGVDSNNVTYLLSRTNPANGLSAKQVFLPPMHIRMVATNNSAAPQQFTGALTIKSGLL